MCLMTLDTNVCIFVERKGVREKAVFFTWKISVKMVDTSKKLVKTTAKITPRRREVNIIELIAEATKPILEQLIGINHQLAKISQQFESRQLESVAAVEQRAVKAKVMVTKVNSDLNEKGKKSMKETEKIYKDLILPLQVCGEGVVLNLVDGKEFESAFKTREPLRCHWAWKTRPERKRFNTGELPFGNGGRDAAEVGVNV
ncbi:UNVERIFIED_CONTAM: hypothetical protein K2H54_044839 [Gekko kuhli]